MYTPKDVDRAVNLINKGIIELTDLKDSAFKTEVENRVTAQ